MLLFLSQGTFYHNIFYTAVVRFLTSTPGELYAQYLSQELEKPVSYFNTSVEYVLNCLAVSMDAHDSLKVWVWS